jgi:HK97 family phage major capsid protein
MKPMSVEKPIKLISGSFTIDAQAADGEPSRSITGLAVPWNVTTIDSLGTKVMFMPGSLPEDGRPPRLLESHDPSKVRGLVTERVSTDEGMMFTARLAPTRDADDTMALLLMGAYDSVSVGVTPTKFSFDNNGTMVVKEARWSELSIVSDGAFEAAKITSVAASAPDDETTEETTENQTVPEENTEMTENNPVEAAAPATVPTTLFATPRREFRMPSAAEYIAAYTRGGHDFAQLNANIRAAAGDEVLTDVPGLLPTPVLAPIFDDINPIRPLVSALGPRSMPQAGKVFIRPKITTHTQVGEQNTELTGLDTRTMVVDDVQVTKRTFGGTVLLSEQTIDFSDPSMLTAVLNDLAGQYALATEKDACDTMVSGIGAGNREVTDLTDAEEVVADLYGIAAIIAGVGNYLPTHLIVSPKTWAKLGSLVDQQGRPVFPQTAPINGIGTLPGGVTAWNGNPLGLQMVVSNQITTQAIGGNDAEDYIFLANSRFMEVYEQQKGAISIEVPSTLGRQISFRGYFSSVIMEDAFLWALGPAV